MARARSPDSIEAEKMYRSGMKLVEIAEKLGVPDGTVRRWKSTQKWEGLGNVKSERSEKKKTSVRKPGPPKGNKNAEGAGAPIRNKNAEKHGAYSKIYWDCLDEEEQQLMQDIPVGEEYQLQQQITMYTIRERRLMHNIAEFKKAANKGLYIKGIKKKKRVVYDDQGGKHNSFEDTNTDTEYAVKALMALESELTKVQRAKTKCIDSLIRLRAIEERHDDLLNGWQSKAEAAAREEFIDEGEDVSIYLPDNGRG